MRVYEESIERNEYARVRSMSDAQIARELDQRRVIAWMSQTRGGRNLNARQVRILRAVRCERFDSAA